MPIKYTRFAWHACNAWGFVNSLAAIWFNSILHGQTNMPLGGSQWQHCVIQTQTFQLTFQTKTLPLPDPAATCRPSGEKQAVHQMVPTLNAGALKVCFTSKVWGLTVFRRLSLPHVSTVPAHHQCHLSSRPSPVAGRGGTPWGSP